MGKKRYLMAGLAGAMTGVAAWLIPGLRTTPAERERRRRLAVNAHGRTGNAMIVDFHGGTLCYSYLVSGVEYMAFQDVTALAAFLPDDPGVLIDTPATLKYLARNPANSIVVCEEWSGLRAQPRATAT
ncbi:MAG: hypothetical protein ACM336_21675 [Acidobacteriota bacterium]